MRALTLMFAFAAVALAGRARAEDDPACAQYQEPLAYNACLARHGPKADLATSPGSTPGPCPTGRRGAPAAAKGGESRKFLAPRRPRARPHGVSGEMKESLRARRPSPRNGPDAAPLSPRSGRTSAGAAFLRLSPPRRGHAESLHHNLYSSERLFAVMWITPRARSLQV